MNKKKLKMSNRILGITAKRNIRNELIIIEVKTPRRYPVDEQILKNSGITLGNILYFEIVDGKPARFVRVLTSEIFENNVNLVPNDSFTVIDNITGVLEDTGGPNTKFYFKVDKLGKCAYIGNERLLKDQNGLPRFGERCALKVKLLDEDEKIGVFTTFTWGCELRQPENKYVKEAIEMEKKDRETEARQMIGIVVSEYNSKKFVWTKQAFPGNLGTIYEEGHRDITVGTWIRMSFSPSDYNKHFPTNKNIHTPKFKAVNYVKIGPKYPTKSVRNGTNIEITIMGMKTKPNHKKGDDLESSDFGIIHDAEGLVREGPGKYTVVITRTTARETQHGNLSPWNVVEAKKEKRDRSRNRSRSRARVPAKDRKRSRSILKRSGTSSERKKERVVWKDEAGGKLEHERTFTDRSSTVYGMDDTELSRGMENLKINHDRNNYYDNNNQNNEPSIRQAVNKFTKRAIITNVKENKLHPGGTTCFLWLIDDHIDSIYYTRTREPHLINGYVFEGQFKNAKKQGCFECIVDNRPLSLDSIEILNCENYIEVSLRTSINTLEHPLFGTLKNVNELPLENHQNRRNEVCVAIIRAPKGGWVVKRVLPNTSGVGI